MAVYQGARLRTDAMAAADASARQARAAGPASVGTSSRVRPMGLLMAVIVAATMLGLVYLTQTLGSNATNTEIWRLERQAGELAKDSRTLQIIAMRAKQPDNIVPRAKKQQLERLDDPVVLSTP